MRPKRRNVVSDDSAQDNIEYALLLAFIILAACCIVMLSGESVENIWTQSNGVLSQAHSAATGSGS